MIVSYKTTGPAGYPPNTGWLPRVANIEKVAGAVVGVGSSCEFKPTVVNCSGNVVTVMLSNASGALVAVSTILSSVNFVIFAEGI
jgi:hypothetical protein